VSERTPAALGFLPFALSLSFTPAERGRRGKGRKKEKNHSSREGEEGEKKKERENGVGIYFPLLFQLYIIRANGPRPKRGETSTRETGGGKGGSRRYGARTANERHSPGFINLLYSLPE